MIGGDRAQPLDHGVRCVPRLGLIGRFDDDSAPDRTHPYLAGDAGQILRWDQQPTILDLQGIHVTDSLGNGLIG